jgi:NAD(P)-dependent dehydrogenase (short-subunit alcohol dehydrogenase family)
MSNEAGLRQNPMDITRAVGIAPMDRKGTTDEIADVVLFLCSEKASFVQGAAWVVDGGYTIN